MRTHRLAALVLTALFFALPAGQCQRTTSADLVKAAVLRCDEARAYATVAANTLALEDQLHDDCLYAHANGRTQTKKEFIAAIGSGELHYDVLRYLSVPTVRRRDGDCERPGTPRGRGEGRRCDQPGHHLYGRLCDRGRVVETRVVSLDPGAALNLRLCRTVIAAADASAG